MRRRYDRAGILALYPQAFWDYFVEVVEPSVELLGDVAVVEIRGPLEHHDGWWADSYESILDRVTAACATPAAAIVLKIDSPGGELLGCFDAARTIRTRAAAAGKKLIAYVDGCACSAAYALACSAEKIYASDTAFLGSIGILITRVDASKRDAQTGIEYALVASGKRKVDGNPHASLSPDELTSMQGQCDSLAAIFFELVASLRGVDAAAVAALEADIFHGTRAVEHRLADAVCTFDDLLAGLSAGAGGPMTEKKDEETTESAATESDEEASTTSASGEVDQAIALLEEAAKGDGEEAERARKALEQLRGSEASDDDDESASSSARTGAGRGVSAQSAAGLAAEFARMSAKVERLEREADKSKLTALLAGRADLGKELAAHLATMPYRDAKAIVDKMPKSTPPKPAATATVTGTRGKGQESAAVDSPSPAKDEGTKALDAAFNRGASSGGVKREGTRQTFSLGDPKPKAQQTAAADAGKGSAA